MKSKFLNIEAEVLSDSSDISTFQFQHQQARLVFQQGQQKSQSSATITSHHVGLIEKKKSISVFLFVMANFALLVLVFQAVPEFFTPNCPPKTIFSIGSLIGVALIMLVTSYSLVGLKQMFFLYFLLDTIFLSCIAQIIGLIAMLDIFQQRYPLFTNALKVLSSINSICTAGTYRILLKHSKLNRWQNILLKTTIMADGMCYFMIGVYIMFVNYEISKGMILQMDFLFHDLSLLFVFGGLAFCKQLLNLHNRFDHTTKLSHKYQIPDEINDQLVSNIADNNNSDEKITDVQQKINETKEQNAHIIIGQSLRKQSKQMVNQKKTQS